MANVTTVQTIAALQATATPAGAVTQLSKAGREGNFIWKTGDFTTQATSDPLMGIYVPSTVTAITSGCWVREWDGITGRPEWFGAQVNNSGFDNQPAIQAAINLCPTIELGAGTYYTGSRLLITNDSSARQNGTRLIGAGHTQTDQNANSRSTQIMCTSATETILQVGSDSGEKPSSLVEAVVLKGFSVNRSVNPFTPSSGVDGSIGIALRWCVNCHFEEVFSLNSCRGWFFYGTVETYVKWCAALRNREGSNPANDPFIGFHLDYSAENEYNGGNAATYLTYCRTFPLTEETAPSLTYSAGVRMDAGWVDLYIHGFETGAGIQYGIHGIGDGYSSDSFRTEDLIITNCVLDPGATACIKLEQAGPKSAVTIADSYLAPAATGTAVVLYQLGGSITVANNQCIVSGFSATGISATQVNNLRASGNIYTGLRQPIWMDQVNSFDVRDTIHGLVTTGDYPALGLSSCTRGKIDCIVNGPGGCYTKGADLQGGSNSLIQVEATNIQAGAISGGSANKIVHNGTQITAAGSFGTNCLASGIMV